MPATLTQPSTPATSAPASPPAPHAPAAPDTGVAHGAPSTGAAPSSFKPFNPAFEGVKSRLMERLEKKGAAPQRTATPAKPAQPAPDRDKLTPPPKTTTPAATTTDDAATAEHAEVREPSGEAQDTAQTGAGEDGKAKAGEATTAPAPAKEKKVSPWRVIDDYKKTNAELRTRAEAAEKEVATLKAGRPADADVKALRTQLDEANKRIQAYEDDLRFTNYQRHPEFVEKYDKPYVAMMARATKILGELTVTNADGSVRTANADDMLTLLNLPLGEARNRADAMFGPLANDVMGLRDKIKDTFDARAGALEEARKNGAVREKQFREQMETEQRTMHELVENTWNTAQREATTNEKHGKYFSPVEGDQKGNSALAKGIEFADAAFRANPLEPGLSKEAREDIVRRHVALRNRAAAYPRMRQWIEERDARIKELEAQLDELSQSEPTTSGGDAAPTAAPASTASTFSARMEARLRKMAR